MSLTKEDIFKADDLPQEKLSVPEWGGHVHVRMLSGAERDEYLASLMEHQPDGTLRARIGNNNTARLLSLCLADGTGTRLFTASEASALGEKNGAVLERLAQVALSLNRLTERDIEEAEKNSATTPSVDSGSS